MKELRDHTAGYEGIFGLISLESPPPYPFDLRILVSLVI